MSITSRCRFVVGTIDGKSVSYIVDQPVTNVPAAPSHERPLTSYAAAPKSGNYSHDRPFTSTSNAVKIEEPNDAKVNGSVTLNNQQLDELMDILQQHHVGEQQQNKQAWSEDEVSLNEQYLNECHSAVHEEPTKDCDYHDDSRDSGYYGISAMKPTLLELKKQQWAKERAEMQGLLSPWGRPNSEKHVSNHYETDNADLKRPNTTKSNQLPIITHEYASRNETDYYDSNYPTDTSYTHSPASRFSRSPANHDRSVRFNENQDEGRLKWGDRGVAVGHLWEPSTSPSRLPEPQHTNPAWLEKSLGSGGYEDPSILHGRKVHMEPIEMEEREKKRRKALENQKAIREQLEERDRRRREEKERRAAEEKEEEERIRKENAIIEERYMTERRREKKKADEEQGESVQHHAPGGNNVQKQGWNKKEASPRGKHRQRRDTENGKHRRNNIIPSHEPEILTLHHPDESYLLREDYMSKAINMSGGEDEMILLGKEVAVLLAPELERRILMSRSGRDASTQTEISQIFNRRNKKITPPSPILEKPIWGANRTTKKYIKQSDKDIYRQRGSSLNSRSKMTTDSTDDSDKYPRSSPQLDRRKRAQSLGKRNNANFRSSDEDMQNFGGRKTRKDSWQETKVLAPVSWSVDVRESPTANMLPRRATNSPPVPALLSKKYANSYDERYTPSPKLQTPAQCPPSPPVPAVLRQLQEQALPPLVSQNGETKVLRSAPPVLKSLPLEIEDGPTLALPEIKQNLMNLPSESSDLLSQLSTIRKNKQMEWQALADEA